jgi:hypothetical protein
MRGLRWLPLWLLSTLAWAAPDPLVFYYDFLRDYQPQPAAFRITYTNPAGDALGAMETAPSAIGACDRPDQTSTEDTYCTIWPECPTDSIVVFFVQAVWDAKTVSSTSNLTTCVFVAGEPCVCHDGATYTPPPPDPEKESVVDPGPQIQIPPAAT